MDSDAEVLAGIMFLISKRTLISSLASLFQRALFCITQEYSIQVFSITKTACSLMFDFLSTIEIRLCSAHVLLVKRFNY